MFPDASFVNVDVGYSWNCAPTTALPSPEYPQQSALMAMGIEEGSVCSKLISSMDQTPPSASATNGRPVIGPKLATGFPDPSGVNRYTMYPSSSGYTLRRYTL